MSSRVYKTINAAVGFSNVKQDSVVHSTHLQSQVQLTHCKGKPPDTNISGSSRKLLLDKIKTYGVKLIKFRPFTLCLTIATVSHLTVKM